MLAMPLLWLVPAAITAAGAIFLWLAVTRLSSEAARMTGAIQRWDGLRPAVIQVRDEADQLRAHLEQLRSGR
jgi:hypothetical protein